MIVNRVLRLYRKHGAETTRRMIAWRLKAGLGLTSWEPWLDSYIPRSGEVAIDVGANNGQWTKVLAQRFRRVLAIEPQPLQAVKLRRTMPKNVNVLQCAAWSGLGYEEMIGFGQSELSTMQHHDLIETNGPPKTRLYVPTMPLDVMDMPEPDFIKIDVEGPEFEVLLGATSILEEAKPTLLVEIHSEKAKSDIKAGLYDFGYDVVEVKAPFYHPGDPARDIHVWLYAAQPRNHDHIKVEKAVSVYTNGAPVPGIN